MRSRRAFLSAKGVTPVGAAIHAVDFSADGIGLPMLANAQAAASPVERMNLELSANVVLAVIGAPSVIALIYL